MERSGTEKGLLPSLRVLIPRCARDASLPDSYTLSCRNCLGSFADLPSIIKQLDVSEYVRFYIFYCTVILFVNQLLLRLKSVIALFRAVCYSATQISQYSSCGMPSIVTIQSCSSICMYTLPPSFNCSLTYEYESVSIGLNMVPSGSVIP